ncbi:MAG: FHA domain-containing protein [Proteobacteria bacterium]|nr:FHA domain-containing protein [Pseudomonadota bacterium]MBS0548210.1 FHA domain-containing protein [Pseudomonadota bacterium]
MLGVTFASLLSLLGLTSAFAFVGLVLAGWMAWRIVAKAGLPGWTGLGAILLTLTAVGAVVPVVLLWIFAFMRWPRDTQPARVIGPEATPAPTQATPAAALPAPAIALPARGWRLAGGGVSLALDGASPFYFLTGAPAKGPTELTVPDSSVGQPHARLLVAGTRLGLEDLGSANGTFIDGARLLPEHGARDVSGARTIRLGTVDLTLSKG